MGAQRRRNIGDMQQSDSPERELTLGEALSIAIVLQKNAQLAEAQKLYEGILEIAPDHAEALHFAGVLAHQQGRSDDAIALIDRSLQLAPGHADWYSNLGIILQAQDKLDDAISAYQRAISLNPDHANAHSNLGVLLRGSGKPVEAENAYRTAIRIDPAHIDAYHNLGVLLTALNRNEEAVACFCKVITLRPKHREARKLMALAHCTIGEVHAAVKIFEEWLEEEAADPIALHMLAACTGRNVPSRASDAYVAETFDSFAASFESKLASLSYRAPALIVAVLEQSGIVPVKSLDVLDAGCGTGLCGPLVAPYARRLIGVDLSAGMLAQAKDKHLYDDLVKRELTEYLRDSAAAFDLIISADTLVYFGDLHDFIRAAARALRPNGILIFTLEHASGADPSIDYRLELHGRYSHSYDYVKRLLSGAGLMPDIAHAELRMESGAPVAGLVIRAARSDASINLPCLP